MFAKLVRQLPQKFLPSKIWKHICGIAAESQIQCRHARYGLGNYQCIHQNQSAVKIPPLTGRFDSSHNHGNGTFQGKFLPPFVAITGLAYSVYMSCVWNTCKAADEEKVPCYCKSHGCNGALVHLRSRQRHEKEDEDFASTSYDVAQQESQKPSEDTNVDRNLFDDSLYKKGIAVQTLHKGTKETVLQAIASEMLKFSRHPSQTKERLNDDFLMHHRRLPKPNSMPSSYEQALALIKPYLATHFKTYVCGQDCKFLTNQSDNCSDCEGNPKFHKHVNEPTSRKMFHWMPLKYRLARWYGTSNLAHIVQSAHLKRSSDDIQDIYDTDDWRNWFSANGIFAGDGRGIVLGLSTDGVDPFVHKNVKHHSMWPIVLIIYNLPKNIRTKPSMLMLWGIVPPKTEPKGAEPDLDIYMEKLVGELLELTECKIYDAYTKAPFNLKVRLLRFIMDFPGLSKTFHCQHAMGYRACKWCKNRGEREQRKTVFLNNRQFLEMSHPLRNDTKLFKSKTKELNAPPGALSLEEAKKFRMEYDNEARKVKKAEIASRTGLKGDYPFMKLEYHNMHEQCMPDPMHTIKNVNDHILELLISGVRSGDDTPCQLSVNEKELANSRVRSLNIPDGFDIEIGPWFSNKSLLTKSHHHKQFATQGIVQYCLRDCLPEQQRRTLLNLYGQFADMFAETHKRNDLKDLERRVNEALALMERDFPLSLQNITTHILRHISDRIKSFGPVYSNWMFPLEAFNSWIIRRCNNRSAPEATVMETYAIADWCTYLVASGRLKDVPLKNEEMTLVHTLSCLEPCEEYTSEDTESGPSTNVRYMLNQQDIKVLQHEYNEEAVESLTDVVYQKKHSYKVDENGRKLHYSAEAEGGRKLKHRSNIVAMLIEEIPRFGKIKFLFEHTHDGKKTDWAMVAFYPQPHIDEASQIWVADLREQHNLPAPLTKLSRPLLHAIESDQIWFVNYHYFPHGQKFFEGGHLMIGL